MATTAGLLLRRQFLAQIRPRARAASMATAAPAGAAARPHSPSSALPRSFSSYLVTPAELHEALGKNPASPISPEPRVVPLCAAWFMPNDDHGRTGIQVYREQRIPRARFFDLDRVIDRRSPYPHMLSGPREFAAAMGELGIRREDTVVVYDSRELGIFSAPRVGWTLRVFGHPHVHLLNNFRLWVDQGLPTESGELYGVECCPYPIPHMDEARVASFDEVREAVLDHSREGPSRVQVLDARPHGRWAGAAPEPREGMPSGHMPGSISIPFGEVLDPVTKTFYPAERLRQLFAEKGVDPDRAIISSCGTGVTACIIETALEEAHIGTAETRRVYDGSWTEWAQRVKPSEGLIRKEGEP